MRETPESGPRSSETFVADREGKPPMMPGLLDGSRKALACRRRLLRNCQLRSLERRPSWVPSPRPSSSSGVPGAEDLPVPLELHGWS